MSLATWTCVKYILAYYEEFDYPSNIDFKWQLSEIIMALMKSYKWQKLNHIEKSWTWSEIETDLFKHKCTYFY